MTIRNDKHEKNIQIIVSLWKCICLCCINYCCFGHFLSVVKDDRLHNLPAVLNYLVCVSQESSKYVLILCRSVFFQPEDQDAGKWFED